MKPTAPILNKSKNDISGNKKLEEDFELLVNSLPNAIILINNKGEILLVNKQAVSLFGFSQKELLGKQIDILIPERFSKIHVTHQSSFFKKPEIRVLGERKELYGLHKDGYEIPVEIGLNPIETNNGIFVIISILDTTKKKKTEQALKDYEERYHTSLDYIKEGFQIIGYDWRYLYINNAAVEQGQISKDELVGKTMMELYPGIENTEMFKKLHECMTNRISINMENEFVYPNGKKNWFLLNMEPVPDEVLILSRDINLEKQTEKELDLYRENLEKLVKERTAQLENKTKELNNVLEFVERREQNLKLIFESIKDYGIILLDTKGYITDWNPGAARLTFYKDDEIIGKHYSIFFTDEDKAANLPRKELTDTMKDKIVEREGWRIRKDKSKFWTYSILYAMRNKSGELISYVKIIKDMTAKKEFEEKLKLQSKNLEEANKELESFSYSVSHDLRAPLRHIDGFVNLILSEEDNKLTKDSELYFKYVIDSVNKMGILIDDLLAFSRTGRAQVKKSKVNLNTLVDTVIKDLDPELKDRKIEWKINRLPIVLGDEILLRQVFANLISNALKFNRIKEKAIIKVGTKEGDEEIIYMNDNGAGFDMKYVDKLFGVFQRLHSDSEFEGTGIGLANVRRIINKHGGRVWAEGEVNEGATIFFTLNNGNS